MQPENRREYRHIETELRAYDPIETVNPQFDDSELLGDITQDIVKIDDILASDRTLSNRERQDLYNMGVDLRLDWLYAKNGGQAASTHELGNYMTDTQNFINTAISHAETHSPHHPQLGWALKMRKFDLSGVAIQRFAKESQTVLKGTEDGEKLWGRAESMAKTVLHGSLELMKEMAAVSDGGSELASDARGSLYELMLMTYARSRVLEEQTLDTTAVRGALSREDRPWNGHAYPKRSFDMVIQREGEDPLLYQAKNYNNHDEYADPIQKTQDTNFGQTLRELPTYIRDFGIVIANPADPNLRDRLNVAGRRLDEAFGRQLQLVS